MFKVAYSKLPPSASNAQIAEVAAPLVSAYRQVDRNLLSIDWPATVRADIDALVKADATFEGVMDSISSQSSVSASQWSQQFSTAASQVNAAVNIVRRDLGLPLVPAGS